jgi:hypothetical protein
MRVALLRRVEQCQEAFLEAMMVRGVKTHPGQGS